jgi:hypothetical protein
VKCTCMPSLDAQLFIDFVIKYFKICLIAIFYKEIILKTRLGQAYCQDLLSRILYKLISYFSELYPIFYVF